MNWWKFCGRSGEGTHTAYDGMVRFDYQMVLTSLHCRMRSSRVTSAVPSARAVAAIRRSAGSREKSSGNCQASAAISGVMDLISTPASSTSLRTDASTLPRGVICPRENIMAISQRLIAAMAIPPLARARRIADAARRERRAGSSISQTNTWVSRRISASPPNPQEAPRETQYRQRSRTPP